MKKILLFLLITSALYSEAKIYLGASYGSFNESFSEEDMKENANPSIKIKAGYGVREAYAVEFSLDYTTVNEEGTDVPRYGMNVELLKALDTPYVNPFFKAGFGTGYVDRVNDTYTYGSFNLGAGLFIPINEHLDVELCYDYKYISYERETETQAITSNANSIYIGINTRY